MTIDNDNFFDIAEAIHCHASLNHNGQTCWLYEILSRSKFKAGPLWREEYCERENQYYGEITLLSEDELKELFDKLEQFIDERDIK